MSEFNLVMPKGANRDRKRLGRGSSSGLGKTAGKGHKGQKARSGGKVYAGFEGGQMPLYRRLAKKGFSNYPFSRIHEVINLSVIEKKFNEGDTVEGYTLCEKGLLKKEHTSVKILGDGVLTKKLTFKVNAVSVSARDKIEKLGGTIELS